MDELLLSYTDRFRTSFELTHRKIGQAVFTELATDLTMPQFFMLYMIRKEVSPKQSHLADKMGVKPSAITVMIDRLVQSKHVIRKHHDTDRRIVLVELTEHGKEVLKQAEEVHKQFMAKGLSQLPPDELRILVESFEKLASYY
ncbi:MarR family winged helix-turn-helix transcriptional regulator [Paenibacillus sp. N3.4]|uniref:MarR family winged helix-turn-helix transcriptional regulator n=1 Tax=Paenibacillus sp. N3.4 TaxID=2603222 RepID=UPI0011C9A50F|nr:MarR family transcriptional regulator [Paenibacillus sp. N3.4]TXK85526.1 MarR family transcriptional regulator [Paenibacillus sp. N3.4]